MSAPSSFLQGEGNEPPDGLGAGGEVVLGSAPVVQVAAHFFRQTDGGHRVFTRGRPTPLFRYYFFC
jgi:hypothetical protein